MSAVPNVARPRVARDGEPQGMARLLRSAWVRVALYLGGFAALLVAGLTLFFIHPELDSASGDIRLLRYDFSVAAGQVFTPVTQSHYFGLLAVFFAGTALCWFATWRATFLAWTGRIAARIPLLLFLYAWAGFAAEAGLIG